MVCRVVRLTETVDIDEGKIAVATTLIRKQVDAFGT